MSIARLMQMGAAGAPKSEPWLADLANASYDSVSFSVAGQDTFPFGLFFKPDGTKVYVVGNTGDDINEYDLSTAWDISSASYLQNFSVSTQQSNPRGVSFKPDGTKMYVVGTVPDSVHEYDLSSAWDISSASVLQDVSVSPESFDPMGLFLKSDGTKMYVAGNGRLNEYDLSSAWDISTASYLQNFDPAEEATPRDVQFSTDGSKMFSVGLDGDAVHEYSLSSAWDISSASFVQSFSVASQEASPLGLAFKIDGTKMYVVGSTSDTIYQYSTSSSTPATLTYPASVDWPSGTAPDAPADGETDVLVFYTEDGGTTYYGFQAGDAMS